MRRQHDKRCASSRGKRCKCSCGGSLHGADLVQPDGGDEEVEPRYCRDCGCRVTPIEYESYEGFCGECYPYFNSARTGGTWWKHTSEEDWDGEPC